MGLDVWLFQFKGVDTAAVAKLWQCDRSGVSREELVAKARELDLPVSIIGPEMGGANIRFPSKKYPPWWVGDWYSLSSTRGIMRDFTGKDLDFVFPEIKTELRVFQPDWLEAKRKLPEIVSELEKLDLAQFKKPLPSGLGVSQAAS
jgi:hypothetical protein